MNEVFRQGETYPTFVHIVRDGYATANSVRQTGRPIGKAGFAFGAYGWSKGGAKAVNEYLDAMKFEIMREPLEAKYRPGEAELEECRQAGKMLAEKALSAAAGN